jgi:hypothetical protein
LKDKILGKQKVMNKDLERKTMWMWLWDACTHEDKGRNRLGLEWERLCKSVRECAQYTSSMPPNLPGFIFQKWSQNHRYSIWATNESRQILKATGSTEESCRYSHKWTVWEERKTLGNNKGSIYPVLLGVCISYKSLMEINSSEKRQWGQKNSITLWLQFYILNWGARNSKWMHLGNKASHSVLFH